MNDAVGSRIGKFVLIYFDAALVITNPAAERLVHLRESLEVLRQRKVYAKMSKCDFEKTKASCTSWVMLLLHVG